MSQEIRARRQHVRLADRVIASEEQPTAILTEHCRLWEQSHGHRPGLSTMSRACYPYPARYGAARRGVSVTQIRRLLLQARGGLPLPEEPLSVDIDGYQTVKDDASGYRAPSLPRPRPRPKRPSTTASHE